MIAQATAVKPAAEVKTCSIISSDLTISHEPEENLATFSKYSEADLEAFPKKVLELDREGYPMGDDPIANAYFDPNFVTLPNEPF